MKKLIDGLSGIKNIFSQQQHSAEGTNAGCVEFKDAARRTCGRKHGPHYRNEPQSEVQPKVGVHNHVSFVTEIG